ncbi:uncharacterized protein LOC118143730 [Callithrix jacchus]
MKEAGKREAPGGQEVLTRTRCLGPNARGRRAGSAQPCPSRTHPAHSGSAGRLRIHLPTWPGGRARGRAPEGPLSTPRGASPTPAQEGSPRGPGAPRAPQPSPRAGMFGALENLDNFCMNSPNQRASTLDLKCMAFV